MVAEAKRSNVVDQVGPTGPRLLRVDDVADRLAISRSMAWKIVSSGEMRSVRIGRAVRVSTGWSIFCVTVGLLGMLFHAAFDRDVVLRVKVRYYGGLSAVDK